MPDRQINCDSITLNKILNRIEPIHRAKNNFLCGAIESKMIPLIIGADKHMLHPSIYDALYQLNMTS